MTHDIFLQVIAFLLMGFLSGLLYPVFFQIIGGPMPKAETDIQRRYPETEELRVTKPNMILRAYGAWLAKGQNAWNDKYNKSLLHSVQIPFSGFPSDEKPLLLSTSYGRGGQLNSLSPRAISETGITCLSVNQATGYMWNIVVKLLPGETCVINYNGEGGHVKPAYSKPLFPDWVPSKMPISPYKALGLCPTCTVFYFCAFFSGVGFFIGLYPGLTLLLFPGAYALASWAITIPKS